MWNEYIKSISKLKNLDQNLHTMDDYKFLIADVDDMRVILIYKKGEIDKFYYKILFNSATVSVYDYKEIITIPVDEEINDITYTLEYGRPPKIDMINNIIKEFNL